MGTALFFGGHPLLGDAALWLGVAVIALLDLLVVATVGQARPVSRTAALVLLPCLAWILYASTLNRGDPLLLGLGRPLLPRGGAGAEVDPAPLLAPGASTVPAC